MAGIFYQTGDRYDIRRKRRENQPYRTTPRGGREGCWGRSDAPFPGTYNPANCNRWKLYTHRY